MLREMNIDKFMEELASKSPAPGGGSVAALAGALGASLTAMVYNLTIDNKAGEGLDDKVIEDMKAKREEMLRIKTEFIDLLEEDTENFNKFMDALKMPKSSDEEKASRKIALDESKAAIIKSPESIAFLGDKIWDAIELAETYGNPNAVSDAGVAALMMDACIKAALLNVKINLPMVKDEARRSEIEAYLVDIAKKSEERKNKIYESVNKKLDA